MNNPRFIALISEAVCYYPYPERELFVEIMLILRELPISDDLHWMILSSLSADALLMNNATGDIDWEHRIDDPEPEWEEVDYVFIGLRWLAFCIIVFIN